MRSITLALALLASVSLAQQPEQQPTAPKRPPVQKVIFGEKEIEGGIERPAGTIYAVPPRAKFGCRIQVRMNFNDKLAESVHEM